MLELSKSKAKMVELSAVVTRSDGTIENLGVVARHYSNPFKQALWKLKSFLKNIFK